MKQTKIILVDDHQLVIEGLVLLIENQVNIEIVNTYNSAKDLLLFLEKNSDAAEIIFLDLKMPEMSGLECAEILKNQYPNLKIAILSMEDDAALINQLINDIGVNAYLSKGIRRNELLEAVHQIQENNLYISEDIESILSKYREKLIEIDEIKLTFREKQVVNLMCKGFTNEQLAQKLFISESTVATHRKNIYRKTNTHNIGQLAEKLKL